MNMKDDGVVRKMCEETILKDLLEKIKPIRLKYKKLEEKQLRFNIFSILRRKDDEVKLHSRFIYELLNPKTEHKQEEKFLKEFLSILKEGKELANFFSDDELSTISVERERDNIDILISSKDKAIIIENKIHSDYGDNQLSGYKNTVKKQGYKEENIKTVYLTLYGDEVPAKEERDETVRKETVLLSYKEHIVRWLEACIEKVALIPTIRETLQQYLKLIKQLTGRALNEEETMEVKKLFLDNKDYIKAFANAQEGFVAAQKELKVEFWEELKKRFKNEYKNIEKIYGCECVPICEIEGKDTISFFIYYWHKDSGDYRAHYGFKFSNYGTLREKIIKDMAQVLEKSRQPKHDLVWWKNTCDHHWSVFYFDEEAARDKFVDEKFQGFKKLIDTLKQSEEFKKYNWLV